MKKLFAILIVGFLFTSCACMGMGQSPFAFGPNDPPFATGAPVWGPSMAPVKTDMPPTAAPTEILTDVPTEAPTDAPTEAPTDSPTEAPSAPQPQFPGMPRIGRLCEGPIFPEPAKYLVISGESDNFYVYNNMGELISTFHAVEDEYAWGYPGLFGEEGICENVRIATGEPVEPFNLFDDMIFYTDWYSDDSDWGAYITKMSNADFEEQFSEETVGRRFKIGNAGGVLHIGGNYLVLDRSMHWEYENLTTGLTYNSDPLLLDRAGNTIGVLDPEQFPTIIGVLGGQYLICTEDDGAFIWESMEQFRTDVYSLDGRLLMKDLSPVCCSYFAVDDEGSYGMLVAANYMQDAQGNYYDKDLKRIAELPEGGDENPVRARYGNLEFEDYQFWGWGNVYVGVKDAAGGWIFRIYNPKLASDHDNERWDDEIIGD